MTPQAAQVALKFCDAIFTECPRSAPASWKVRQMAKDFGKFDQSAFDQMFPPFNPDKKP